jgi:hypothetical protein
MVGQFKLGSGNGLVLLVPQTDVSEPAAGLLLAPSAA